MLVEGKGKTNSSGSTIQYLTRRSLSSSSPYYYNGSDADDLTVDNFLVVPDYQLSGTQSTDTYSAKSTDVGSKFSASFYYTGAKASSYSTSNHQLTLTVSRTCCSLSLVKGSTQSKYLTDDYVKIYLVKPSVSALKSS